MHLKNSITIVTALGASLALTATALALPRPDEEKSGKSGQPEGGIANAATCGAQKLVGYDADVEDLVGSSAALSGNRLILGAPWDDNAVGVNAGKVTSWERINGAWQQGPGPAPAIPQSGEFFGSGVGLAGDIAVVGAGFHDNFTGTAYFFKRLGSGWTQTAMLTPPDVVQWDYFGMSAAINEAGNLAVFGAPYKDITDDQGTDDDAGEAYIYSRNPNGTWSLEASLWDTDPASRDPVSYLGYHVAISGEVAVIAAQSDNAFGLFDCGSARVYRRTPQHQWNLEAVLFAPQPQLDGYFGASVSIDGNQIAVGATLESSNGLTDNGVVHMFRYTSGTWNYDGKIVAVNPVADEAFGGEVAVSGDRVVISDGDYAQSPGFIKRAFVYRRAAANVWLPEMVLTDPDDNDNGFFGTAVAMDGPRFVVTDYIDDPYGIYNAGAAYVYTVASDDCANAALITAGSYQGCTEGLTAQIQNSCGPNAPSGPDAWFSYTPTCTGPVTIDTNGSSFDTVLSVYTSCPGQGGLNVACDDDSGVGYASQLTFQATAGVNYKIRLAGYNQQAGAFVLELIDSCISGCPADIAPLPSGDGVVNSADLLMIINNWGFNLGPADIAPPPNGNGVVNAADLLMVINSWGACP